MDQNLLPSLLSALHTSGILTAEQLQQAQDGLPQEPVFASRYLLNRGVLTAFQAEWLAQGRGGELLLGPYILLDRLGEGGMGEVFKAQHLAMRRTVALKIIRNELLEKSDAVRRFYREARAAAALQHPNIVLAYDAGQIGATHVFAMEYVEGIDLARLVKESGPLPASRACEYIRQAAEGLRFAHEHGVIHRDIKPANLLLSRTGKPMVKLLDLGLARLEEPSEGEQTLTREGSVLGTPAYIAPEQAMNARNADVRSDLYSLGCTLYYLLCGQAPFRGETATETMLLHHLKEAAKLEELRPEIPPALGALTRKLMAKRPEDRFQTAAVLIQALEAYARGDSTLPEISDIAAPSSAPVRTTSTPTVALDPLSAAAAPAPPGERSWRLPLLVALAGLILALGTVLGMVLLAAMNSRHDTPTKPGSDKATATTTRPPAAMVREVSPLRRWEAHDGGVRGAVFSAKGTRIASAGNDRLARVWDPASGKELQTLRGHRGEVTCIAFTPDARLVVAGCSDQTVRVWDATSGKERFWLRNGHSGPVSAIACPFQRPIALSSDTAGWIRFWNLDAGREFRGFSGPTGAVHAVAFRPGFHDYTLACADGTLRLGTLANANPPQPVKAHKGRALCLAYSADGKMLVSGGEDGTLCSWDPATGERRHLWTLSPGPVRALALSPDGKYAAFGGGGDPSGEGAPLPLDDAIRIWDLEASKLVRTCKGHTGAITTLDFSSDGKQLLSASADGTIGLWLVLD